MKTIEKSEVQVGDRIEFFVGWDITDSGVVTRIDADGITVHAEFLKGAYTIKPNYTRPLYRL